MGSRKRNEWLDADLEESDPDQDSDYLEESRGEALGSRSTKRRRITLDDHSDDHSDAVDDKDEDGHDSQQPINSQDDGQIRKNAEQPKPTSKVERKLSKLSSASSRTGVLYLSHIPPFMKPHTVKKLLAPFAPSGLGRIFLTPEDHDARTSRVRSGGNKKRSFTDGWIEFLSKKEAKLAVDALNTRPMGGKKGGYYFDDMWNLKYLKGFKWRHLTEQIANENAERSARMRAEGASSRREVKEFLRNVERSKIEETRRRKRREKDQKMGLDNDKEKDDPKRAFKVEQNRPIRSVRKSTGDEAGDTARLLRNIF